MQHFLRTVAPVAADSEVVLNQDNPYYQEILHRFPDDPSVWFSCDSVMIDDHTAAGMTCWDQQFDPVFQQLTDRHHGHILADEFRKLWPTFFKLIDNAVDQRYGDGALTQMVDPDDVNRKWFIAVLVGGLRGNAHEYAPRVLQAADRAVELSLAMTREFELAPDVSRTAKARMFLRGCASGYLRGQAITDKWMERLNWLQRVDW